MKIPKICILSEPLTNERAGWHTPNSVVLRDICPEWRLPGGGVCRDELTDLPSALATAISYTKQHIADAESHLRALKRALADVS